MLKIKPKFFCIYSKWTSTMLTMLNQQNSNFTKKLKIKTETQVLYEYNIKKVNIKWFSETNKSKLSVKKSENGLALLYSWIIESNTMIYILYLLLKIYLASLNLSRNTFCAHNLLKTIIVTGIGRSGVGPVKKI